MVDGREASAEDETSFGPAEFSSSGGRGGGSSSRAAGGRCTSTISVAAAFALDGDDAAHATQYNLTQLSFTLSQTCGSGATAVYPGVANLTNLTAATKGLDMRAKVNTSLQCNSSTYNYTLLEKAGADLWLKEVVLADVAVQAFVPATATPSNEFSAADSSAFCPTPALDTTTGIIVGGVIAGVAALFLIVFALGNCGASKSQYQKV